MIRFIVHDGENQTGKHLQPNSAEQLGIASLALGWFLSQVCTHFGLDCAGENDKSVTNKTELRCLASASWKNPDPRILTTKSFSNT